MRGPFAELLKAFRRHRQRTRIRRQYAAAVNDIANVDAAIAANRRALRATRENLSELHHQRDSLDAARLSAETLLLRDIARSI